MEAQLITEEFPLFLPESATRRSPGIHVSGIIRCIATEMGILTRESAEELSLTDHRKITDPTAIMRICMGLAWEEFYIPKILGAYGVVDHPGEMHYDGVYMTHDGEDLSVIITLPEFYPTGKQYRQRVHEVKCTYKSTKTVEDLQSQWLWMAQIKAYCKAKGTRYACLHVLFVCGNYKFPIKPLRNVWLLTFTQAEIDDNWDLLRTYKNEKILADAQKQVELEAGLTGFGDF